MPALARLRRAARGTLRRAVPHRYRPRLRQLYNGATWWLYAGRARSCPCCDRTFRRFRLYQGDSGYQDAMCPRCGSLGRHRVDWLFIRERRLLDADRIRLLHVSPEYSLQARLGSLPNVAYLSADLDSALADERMDVTDIHYEDASFDAVVCNHVLEHVPEDRKAMRELYRVLRPGGWAMVQSPVDRRREETFEDAAITDPADRTRLFGQYDHVRVYGRDYDQRLAEAGFEVEVDDFVQTLDPGAVERMALDRGERIYLCHKPA